MRIQNSVIIGSLLTALAAYALPQNENGGQGIVPNTSNTGNSTSSATPSGSSGTAGDSSSTSLAVATTNSAVSSPVSDKDTASSSKPASGNKKAADNGNKTETAKGNNSTKSAATLGANIPVGFERFIGGGAIIISAFSVGIATLF
ncbi:uncharacterized protein L203_101961 [Cryptococcus depauperatus CBS 7841]|uniref:Uncharacterized protein n=1 Tax=Cryptococcus depauperatus CBS 7841 TaxID=1295531 RepID=A0A1E3IHD7_9TREE|nr:hypothetical protein L203_03212 [Cryptococcus depauperatus CBS 7841]